MWITTLSFRSLPMAQMASMQLFLSLLKASKVYYNIYFILLLLSSFTILITEIDATGGKIYGETFSDRNFTSHQYEQSNGVTWVLNTILQNSANVTLTISIPPQYFSSFIILTYRKFIILPGKRHFILQMKHLILQPTQSNSIWIFNIGHLSHFKMA